MTEAWISVRGWSRFQHYHPNSRSPVWVKNYTDLLSSQAYLDLTAHQRAVLHGLWLMYASSRCQLSVNTRSLSRRLGIRVSSRQLEQLNHAGFIDIVASKTLADGYQNASPEQNRTEQINPYLPTPTLNGDRSNEPNPTETQPIRYLR